MKVQSRFIEMFGECQRKEKLSSLCETFIDGDWIESKDQSEDGIRLVQTGNVGYGYFKDKEDKSRYISEETFNRLHCTEIFAGDILVSRLPAPIGRACIIPAGIGRMITAVDCSIIRLKDVILQEYFISYTMTSTYSAQINEVTTGTTRRRVSRANLGNVLVPCPSLEAQRQFVAISQQADKSKFVGFKSRFIEMVGDPRSNPKGWPMKRLPDVASYSIGLTYKPEHVCEDGTIVLRSGNIQEGEIDLQDLVRVNTPIRENLWVKEGDILMCSRNGSASLVGKVAQIKLIQEPMTYGAFMTIIRSEYSDYLYLYFQSADFRDQISGGKSSTMNQITQKMLDKIEIPLPDQDVISSLSAILKQADKSGFELRKSIDAIDAVIKSLING